MTTFFWIEKNRTKIFAIELLIALIFGPLLGHSVGTGILGFLGVMLVQEIVITAIRFCSAKFGHERTRKKMERTSQQFEEVKQEAKNMGLQMHAPKKDYSKHRKKNRKKKQKH